MHKNEKRPQTLQKSWIVHTARFLKFVQPFFITIHERVILYDGKLLTR